MQMLSAPSVALKACWLDEDAFFDALPDWGKLPISVRHPFCFYYAHMASFAKLKAFPQVGCVRCWCQERLLHTWNLSSAGQRAEIQASCLLLCSSPSAAILPTRRPSAGSGLFPSLSHICARKQGSA